MARRQDGSEEVRRQADPRTRRPRRRPDHAGGPDNGESEEGVTLAVDTFRAWRGSGAPRLRMSSTEVEPRPGGQASGVFVFAAVIGLARARARIGRESRQLKTESDAPRCLRIHILKWVTRLGSACCDRAATGRHPPISTRCWQKSLAPKMVWWLPRPPMARAHRQVRKCALNAAKSISLGIAPCRATTWPMCAAARKYHTAVSAL